MSKTFYIPDQVKVESSVPREVIVDDDVVFLGVVSGTGNGSYGAMLWISQSSHAGCVGDS